jgi:arylamine N-acetyltransferase
MANLVSINGERYLVDVGFGTDGPMLPVPLQNGYMYTIFPPQYGKLEYRSLMQHTDPTQRVWVYSIRDTVDTEWRERYCFTDLEYFPEDFASMNLSPMTLPTSFFVKTVLAMRAIIDEQTNAVTGVITLHKDTIKRKYRGEIEMLEILKNEEQRIKALESYFGIILKPSEQKAIRGLATELLE